MTTRQAQKRINKEFSWHGMVVQSVWEVGERWPIAMCTSAKEPGRVIGYQITDNRIYREGYFSRTPDAWQQSYIDIHPAAHTHEWYPVVGRSGYHLGI